MPDPIRSEDDFLSLADRYFSLSTPHQLLLRGDDCAELAMPGEICLSSDLFLEDVHFRTAYFSYYEIGYKSLAVNLSDLASAGAIPLGFNLNLILPVATTRAAVEEFLRGMGNLAARHHLPLTGGDLSRGDKLGICICIWGEKAGKRFLRRAECRPGDTLFLVGDSPPLALGMARIGLLGLEELGKERALASYPLACKRHLLPTPLLEAGAAIARLDPGASLMDVSDGLARDLPRLLGRSGGSLPAPGAELYIQEELLHPELLARCLELGLDPIEQAVLGGEDYLLLGSTSSPEILPKLEAETGAETLILGRVSKSGPILLNKKEFSHAGFDHFNNQRS